jgi:hypothetical protein
MPSLPCRAQRPAAQPWTARLQSESSCSCAPDRLATPPHCANPRSGTAKHHAQVSELAKAAPLQRRSAPERGRGQRLGDVV